MTLTTELYIAYLSAHLKLLYYVGLKTNELQKQTTFLDFTKSSYKEKFVYREKLIETPDLIDDFLGKYFEALTTPEIKIIEGFKHKITAEFVILKYLEDHAIFLNAETNNFYAVKALSNSFDKMLPSIPLLIRTTILPYQEFIIYDGFLEAYEMQFNSKLKKDLNESYEQAKLEGKIITQINN